MAEENTNITAASIVTEVLASAGRLEKDDLNAKLGKLSSRIQEVKVEVFEALEKKYVDFNPSPNLLAAQQLSTRVSAMEEEMEAIGSKIDKEIKSQLNTSTAEFQDFTSQLEDTVEIQKVLKTIVEIHDLIQMVDECLNMKDFVKAGIYLKKMSSLLEQDTAHIDGKLQIFSALHEKNCMQHSLLESTVSETWSKSAKWMIHTTPGSKQKKKNKVGMYIKSSKEDKALLGNTLQAMQNLDLLDAKLRIFAERFLEHFIRPIATSTETELDMGESRNESDTSKDTLRTIDFVVTYNDTRNIVSPIQAFAKISTVLECLNSHLLDIEVEIEEKSVTLMKLFGQSIAEDCLQLLIKECLSHAIPSNNNDLASFDAVIGTTESFQDHLVKVGFLNASDTTLKDFVGNVNVLFANKQCEQILEKSRGLMTSEIHNMVEIDNDHPFGPGGIPSIGVGSSKKAKMAENMGLAADSKLSASTFRLPKCYISSSVLSLMKLAYSTLKEASNNSQPCAVQLFYCVRNMFELYCTVTPMYHKDSLANLPQLSAIHHNDCIYIAHHLLTLGHQFKAKLPEPLCDGGAATFVDLVPKLRRLGTESFLKQLTTQRDQLEQCLNSANGFMNLSEFDNLSTAERSVKQMLHQLERLSGLWKNVLPINIYHRSIGTLLNSALYKIISCLTSLEDISAEDASHLHSIMSQVTDRGRQILSAADDESTAVLPNQHVPKWTKFTELMIVLSTGLHDIADRWADGKGPLAHEFSSNEMKHLIRALFQNTDRRDTVLAKIK